MTIVTSATGYSGTPLAKKLGLKDGQRVLWISLPPSLNDLRTSAMFIEMAQAGWETFTEGDAGYDVIHGFVTEKSVLADNVVKLRDEIDRDGSIWISWPKKASKVVTDITEDTIREVALPVGLVDVKVCAVDEIWSGLKLVIRKELR